MIVDTLKFLSFIQKRKKFYNGRLDMYEYKFSDKKSQEINEKTNKIDDLFKQFDDIDGKYDFKEEQTSTGELSLERKDYVKPDEETLKKQAESSLTEYKDSSVKKIENDYSSNLQAIDENMTELEKSKQENQSSLKAAYEDVKNDASNDAIKRGLARSSIIVNKLAQYDNSMLTQFAQIEKDYNDSVVKLSNKKSQLEVQRQNALDGFDIAYAVKLTEKINSLNDEIDKKANEVIEYNNKMEQLEKEFIQEQEKLNNSNNNTIRDDNMDLLEYYTKYGKNYVDKLKQEEKYTLAKDYLDTLPKDEAIEILNNNSKFKDNFPTYYSKLISYVYSRTK